MALIEDEPAPSGSEPGVGANVATHDASSQSNSRTLSLNGKPTLADESAQEKATMNGGEKPARAGPSVALPMLALCMAVFLAALDQTIVTTALPTIARDFNASEADYAWIGSAYLLAGAAAMPTWGKISDIFGRKPILLLANFLFFIGSLICALSIDIGMLQAGRVIQGIGAGGLMTLVNICISDMFSMRERGKYMGLVGLTFAFASAVGPLLGGVFTEFVTWRWCFYLNLPCDGLAFIMVVLFLKLETPKTPLLSGLKAVDWAGIVLIVGGTVTLLIGLEFGGVTFPWNSATVICLIVFGVVIFALFGFVESRFAAYPVMPWSIISNRSNVAALLANFAHGFVFISGAYFLPLYFQAVLGASPLLSGVYILPYALTLSIMALGSGLFIAKTGKYLPPIWLGLAMMVLGFGLFINFPGYSSWARVVIFQLIAGFGVGLLFQSPLVAIQAHVAPRDIASATAAFGFTRNLSTAISIVVGGAILSNQMQRRIRAVASKLSPATVQALVGGGIGSATGIPFGLDQYQTQLVLDAYTDSLRVLWIFYTALAFVGLLISFAIKPRVLDTVHTVRETGLEAEKINKAERLAERATEAKQTTAVESAA